MITRAQLAIPVSEADHASGVNTAPVTLVEYGDYECPYCGKAHPVVKELQQRLSKQLRFVFRNFPLTSMHPHAEHAAEAAEAAAAQDQFWPMHDVIFEHQPALRDEHLLHYATALGLDAARVASEIDQHVHAKHVREDFMGGVRSGVNGTPTFFINSVRHDGAFDLASLEDAIESSLAEMGGGPRAQR